MKKPKVEHEHQLECDSCQGIYDRGWLAAKETYAVDTSPLKNQITDWQKRCGEAETELSRSKADVDMARMDLKKQEEISEKWMGAWGKQEARLNERQNRIVTLESDIGALKAKSDKFPLPRLLVFFGGMALGICAGIVLHSHPKPVPAVEKQTVSKDAYQYLLKSTYDDAMALLDYQNKFTECHEYALQEKETIRLLKLRLKGEGR